MNFLARPAGYEQHDGPNMKRWRSIDRAGFTPPVTAKHESCLRNSSRTNCGNEVGERDATCVNAQRNGGGSVRSFRRDSQHSLPLSHEPFGAQEEDRDGQQPGAIPERFRRASQFDLLASIRYERRQFFHLG